MSNLFAMKNISHADKKETFSQRLKQSLATNAMPINSPTNLARRFNALYDGKPVTVQTASTWLSGVSIPNQDKLIVLAHMLGVNAAWLRYGEAHQEGKINMAHLQPEQRELIEDILWLTPKQRQAVSAVVAIFLEK